MNSNPPELPPPPPPPSPEQPPVPQVPPHPQVPPNLQVPPYPQVPQVPPYSQVPPIPPAGQPTPATNGKLWLGILLGAGIPILGTILIFELMSIGLYGISALAPILFMLPFWIVLVTAIVLTIVRSTRRTGIGVWIGIVALPIVGFGVCVTMSI